MPSCFSAHLGAGVARFCLSVLHLVLLLWTFVFILSQLENAIAWLLHVQLTPSNARYVLASYFISHLGGGTVGFGKSVLLLVLLVWIFVFTIGQLKNAIASL
jgi:hypothetical protein